MTPGTACLNVFLSGPYYIRDASSSSSSVRKEIGMRVRAMPFRTADPHRKIHMQLLFLGYHHHTVTVGLWGKRPAIMEWNGNGVIDDENEVNQLAGRGEQAKVETDWSETD